MLQNVLLQSVFYFFVSAELFQRVTSVFKKKKKKKGGLFDWSAGLLLDLSDNLPINVLCP